LHIGVTGHDLERQALEVLVPEKFRAGRLNKDALAQRLAFLMLLRQPRNCSMISGVR